MPHQKDSGHWSGIVQTAAELTRTGCVRFPSPDAKTSPASTGPTCRCATSKHLLPTAALSTRPCLLSMVRTSHTHPPGMLSSMSRYSPDRIRSCSLAMMCATISTRAAHQHSALSALSPPTLDLTRAMASGIPTEVCLATTKGRQTIFQTQQLCRSRHRVWDWPLFLLGSHSCSHEGYAIAGATVLKSFLGSRHHYRHELRAGKA